MRIQFLIIVILFFGVSACASTASNPTLNPNPDKSAPAHQIQVFYVSGDAQDALPARVKQLRHTAGTTHSLREHSVIMLPGLGLSSTLYLTTPDGRAGWASLFAEAGYEVSVMDPTNTGPSGIYAEVPASLTRWDPAQIWPRWGLGATQDKPYAESQFPHASAEQFYASFATRVQETAQARGRGHEGKVGHRQSKRQSLVAASTHDRDALVALLQQQGPSVLIVHSMSGVLGLTIAQDFPELVQALVMIEPVGCPTMPKALGRLTVPVLAVYGDYIDSRRQGPRKAACQQTINALSVRGIDATMIDLPALGVQGNSHVLMVDKNNAEIAQRIMQWLGEIRNNRQ